MRPRWMRTPWDVPQTHGELFEQKGGDATCHPIKHTQTHQDGSNAALTFNPKGAADICQNRHRGNPQSIEAFDAIKDTLTAAQSNVMFYIKRSDGMTVDELAIEMRTNPNSISGRITELRIKGKIEKIGTRPTRTGCPAAVWRAV